MELLEKVQLTCAEARRGCYRYLSQLGQQRGAEGSRREPHVCALVAQTRLRERRVGPLERACEQASARAGQMGQLVGAEAELAQRAQPGVEQLGQLRLR